MKQLKFFTSHADTLTATRRELASLGIAANHMHVFVRRNEDHRYDGLLLHSEHDYDSEALRSQLNMLAFLFIVSAIGIVTDSIGFIGAASLIALYCLLSLVFPSRAGRLAKRQSPRKPRQLYFLVVDVPEERAHLSQDLVRHHPGLVAQ